MVNCACRHTKVVCLCMCIYSVSRACYCCVFVFVIIMCVYSCVYCIAHCLYVCPLTFMYRADLDDEQFLALVNKQWRDHCSQMVIIRICTPYTYVHHAPFMMHDACMYMLQSHQSFSLSTKCLVKTSPVNAFN